MSKHEIECGLNIMMLHRVESEFRITADTQKKLAIRAWNSQQHSVLLSALFQCEVAWNFQSDVSANELTPRDKLHMTNHGMRGISAQPVRKLNEDELVWLAVNYEHAYELLEKSPFDTAVHSLWSYHWHPHPRHKLAILWAGIEGLFEIHSELSFRLSLYVARFLEPDNRERSKEIFEKVKRLYGQRSAAVHGSKMKGDPHGCARESAELLFRLIRRCVEISALPEVEQLAP